MVLLVGGYPIPWNDAKPWALRHWPDMEMEFAANEDEDNLPYIIYRYHKDRGRRMECVPVTIQGEDWLLIVVKSKYDRLSTPRKHRRFEEGESALKYKAELFSHEDDKNLAEKAQFTTIADPFGDGPSARVSSR